MGRFLDPRVLFVFFWGWGWANGNYFFYSLDNGEPWSYHQIVTRWSVIKHGRKNMENHIVAFGKIAHLSFRAVEIDNLIILQQSSGIGWVDLFRVDRDWWREVADGARFRAREKIEDGYDLIKYFLDYGHVDYEDEA